MFDDYEYGDPFWGYYDEVFDFYDLTIPTTPENDPNLYVSTLNYLNPQTIWPITSFMYDDDGIYYEDDQSGGFLDDLSSLFSGLFSQVTTAAGQTLGGAVNQGQLTAQQYLAQLLGQTPTTTTTKTTQTTNLLLFGLLAAAVIAGTVYLARRR